jgi:hypothetical protein
MAFAVSDPFALKGINRNNAVILCCSKENRRAPGVWQPMLTVIWPRLVVDPTADTLLQI